MKSNAINKNKPRTRIRTKICPVKIQILSWSIIIHRLSFDCTHIGGGDSFWNQPFSHISDLRDLDLGSGHTVYRRVSLIDLYLYIKFRSNRINFVARRMYGRTLDTETGLIRSTGMSRPN